VNTPALGLRANLAQFSLLVIVNAFVGAMVGMERTILPAIAEGEFHLVARTAILSFIVAFGITKALTNYLAGRLSDRVGRKAVLVGGWLIATPVPRTFVPTRLPLRAMRSSQLNSSRPLSSASFMNELVA